MAILVSAMKRAVHRDEYRPGQERRSVLRALSLNKFIRHRRINGIRASNTAGPADQFD